MPPGPSPCTLADLLAEPGLGLLPATANADLDRPVKWVQTTELIDPRPYLRPDELVCTVGSSLTTDDAVRTFVEAISGAAAGLCFGLGDVHDHPPESLTQACQRAGLPLLTLPYGVAFLAVADVVEARRGRASDAESLGRLISLIRSGLANPGALSDVLAVHALDPARLVVAAWPAGSSDLLSAHIPGAVIAETGDHTVTISASVDSVAMAVRSTRLRCGYADPVALPGLRSALATALLALTAAPVGGLCGPDDLASFALLIDSIPRERLRPFIARIIEPLLASGARTSPTYIDTLRAFLTHDLSVGRTAKAQFLHPNTVRHRLALIKDITGRDPFVTEDLMTLAVAIRAYDEAAPRR